MGFLDIGLHLLYVLVFFILFYSFLDIDLGLFRILMWGFWIIGLEFLYIDLNFLGNGPGLFGY